MNNKFITTTILGTLFVVNAFSYIAPPPPPTYASCAIVEIVDAPANPDTGARAITHRGIDPGCRKAQDDQYKGALVANATANRLETDANGNLITPTPPRFQDCGADVSASTYSSCAGANAALQRDYNERNNTYNLFLEFRNKYPATAEANANARLSGSATENLAYAENLAKTEGKNQSNISTAANIAAIGFGTAFGISCMTVAGCNPYFGAAAGASAVLSFISSKQAAQNDNTAYNACLSYNNMASTKKECGEKPPPVPDVPKPPDFPYTQVDPNTGKCLDSAPPSCVTNLALLTDKGYNIKDIMAKGPLGFTGKGPFKFNPDGSITMPDGKKYTADDFKDEKSMIAAGMSPAEAQSLANQLYGKDGLLAKAGIDAKAELKSLPAFGTFEAGGGSTTVKSGGADGGNSSGLGERDGKKRKPSSIEGLVRNFNGDSIGIANDDIFKMMNKRYILKSAQDSFIGK